MYQTQCIKIKVKPGKAEVFKTWARHMDQVDTKELAELLAEEGVITEQMFMDKHGEDYYVYFFTKAKNLARANEVFIQSQHPINQKARAIIDECWDLSNACHIEIMADWEGIR
jgi:hypothetical protein